MGSGLDRVRKRGALRRPFFIYTAQDVSLLADVVAECSSGTMKGKMAFFYQFK